ncbi:Epidermal growth factor receptor kinase substrate 8-like protein 2 [Hypsibius exemplaris]|uniref:Epidermal growth factor receptor kinase substrate 8-like protein 2 n=1 Tax=Hypsibius exemplaris TaxID=2072580 RepID=A0A1W0X850_HYPEX|nr:Epidermal growth factor receptor kinase substrate 8-like protein 2 [Hypsibius exemplaris]
MERIIQQRETNFFSLINGGKLLPGGAMQRSDGLGRPDQRFLGRQAAAKANGVLPAKPTTSAKTNGLAATNGKALSNGMSNLNGSTGHVASTSVTSAGYYSGRTSSTGVVDDGALYTVDHLATFTVGESYELMYPQDGIRRLRQMEKSSGIWTQRMYLRLETSWLVIIDFENGDTVERFPLDLVTDPTSFISPDPKELYNNILLFTVKEDPRLKGTSISEMHIFHCLQTSAQKIADDVRLLTKASGKGGALLSRQSAKDRTVIIPPAPIHPAPELPLNGHRVRDRIDIFDNIIDPRRQGRTANNGLSTGASNGRQYIPDEDNDSQRSDSNINYERDVAVLNHCFDDIERFIARLQQASAAYKQLELRRRKRNSNRKEQGDGILTLRARPPAEAEFIDIFQKFKLSFNLLGKLRSHIHDPNAPELVHFLFTPLALVFDASQDADYGPNLASRIVPPLLTAEAKQLLLNCLTSKESDLWQTLGDAWTQTRDDWSSHVPAYYPVFHDGWEPHLPYSDTGRGSRTNGSESWRNERDDDADSQEYGADYPHYIDHHGKSVADSSPSFPRQYSERDQQSDFSDAADSDFDRKQRHFAARLESQNAKIVQVIYARTGKNDKELTVQKGEILEILNSSRKWWQARNRAGLQGYVPCTIVVDYQLVDSAEETYTSYPPSQRQHHTRAARYD